MAGLSGNFDVEVELKTSAEKLWQAIKDTNTLYPKVFPQSYKSIEVVEGDGLSPGSVRLMTLTQGVGIASYVKERIERFDDANKTLYYSVIEGDVMKYYKSYKGRMVVSARGDGSLFKWSVEYVKATDDAPDPTFIRDFGVQNFKDLDVYLQAN